jgi:hypothetical protein
MFLCITVVKETLSFQAMRPILLRKENAMNFQTPVPSQLPRLFMSSESDDKEETDYETEEILLRMHLSVLPDVEYETALAKVQKYTRSFPFAVVLPVQPLQYLPMEDGGVDVRFLRKKTQEKGSIDGGIRFFIDKERDGIEIVVKRNSQGQSVSKMFSEKQVVQSFVKGISGEEPEKTGAAPTYFVAVESFFHKWMQA